MDTQTTPETNGRVGELLHRITDDVKTIAKDEVELVRTELTQTARAAASDAAAAMIGAVVALIGLGMLCVVVVVALAPVVSALWARLLIMALVYLVIGGAVAGGFGQKLRHDAVPDLAPAKYEGERTLKGVAETLTKTEGRTHA
ncbi:MAG: phage holin family protein [Acidobacteriota bacterium]